MADRIIWTIGHSTHSIDEFIRILESFDIDIVADIQKLSRFRTLSHILIKNH